MSIQFFLLRMKMWKGLEHGTFIPCKYFLIKSCFLFFFKVFKADNFYHIQDNMKIRSSSNLQKFYT